MSTNLKITLLGMAAATLMGVAIAEARVATGDIASINAPARMLMLRHNAYHFGKQLPVASLKPGEHVRITYHWSHGERVATRIVPLAAVTATTASGKPVSKVAMHGTMPAKKKPTTVTN